MTTHDKKSNESSTVSKRTEPDERKGLAVYAGIGMSLAFELGGAMALGAWLGTQADRKLGSKPWGLIIGLVFFMILAFVHIIRTLDRLQNSKASKEG